MHRGWEFNGDHPIMVYDKNIAFTLSDLREISENIHHQSGKCLVEHSIL